MSQASSTPRPSISSISTRAPPSFETSSTPDPAVPYVAQHRTWGLESSRRGEWWSKEVGAPVQIGVNFVPDTQDGGGDEFIFIPNIGGCKCVHDAEEAENARARRRAHQQVQRLRRLFPPIPSLTDQLRAYVKSSGQDDKLLRLCGINTATNVVDEHDESKPLVDDDLLLHDESKPLVDHGSESPSSYTWFGSMFKSGSAGPVLSIDPSSASCASPKKTTGMSSSGPFSTAIAGLFRSSRPSVAPSIGGLSSSSKSGGPLRSNTMILVKEREDEREDRRWDEKDEKKKLG